MENIPYANVIGTIMYSMISTRPDLAYSISLLSRFMSNPGKTHWEALKYVLKYINGSLHVGLNFEKRNDTLDLVGYVDSDFAGDRDSCKSTTAYFFKLGGNCFSWKSRLQPLVALSSTEAEYVSITDAFKEAIWLQSLLREISLLQDNERLTKLYTESINKLADQLECRTYCQRLKEELERVRDEYLKKENKYRNSVESLKQDCAAKIKEFETKMKGFLIQKAADEATIRQLNEDLSAHKIHLECLTSKLGLVEFDVESRYHYEVQGLKDCLLIEQEEKNELNKKLQNFEKECV
ncbi:protein At-4/1 isoform X3 [Diospyros lotus]|uniref:protein At-4/1 isoform X3 n=1 Tax=Diospyros lotus TaxID=55363 RepID=UPI00225B53A4|nr:protein At-4/1 isoform X3 [Diospyros lotus]